MIPGKELIQDKKEGVEFQRLLTGRWRKPAEKALVLGAPGFITDSWPEEEVRLSSRKEMRVTKDFGKCIIHFSLTQMPGALAKAWGLGVMSRQGCAVQLLLFVISVKQFWSLGVFWLRTSILSPLGKRCPFAWQENGNGNLIEHAFLWLPGLCEPLISVELPHPPGLGGRSLSQ